MSDSTSVARIEAPSGAEIDTLRRAGSAMLAQKREVREIAKRIEGMEWGSGSSAVTGSGFSESTRLAMAQFCRVTRAEPQTQIDILGGKPYLNANYWADKAASDPHFVKYEQRDLSPSVEERIRSRAKRKGELAKALEEAGKPQEAAAARAAMLRMEDEADEIGRARAEWSPRADATVVVETTIWRFMNAAPLEKIRAGEITDIDRYIVPVRECNWAGNGTSDPVGNANPAKTARTRSFRRCAVKALSGWMRQYEEQINHAEQAIEADWEIIVEDSAERAASLPEIGGPQAVSTGGGEAEATNPRGAKPLPGDPEPEEDEEEEIPEAEVVDDSPAFDPTDARKRLFATLRDAGIAVAERKEWAEENGLPRTTKEWGQAEYEKAIGLLVDPVKDEVRTLIEGDEDRLEDLSLTLLGKSTPDYLSDWQAVRDHLRDGDAERDVPEDL